MSGRRPLKDGARRLLGDHGGAAGRTFRQYYGALAIEFPLSTPLLRLEASRVAAAGVLLEAATAALVAAQRARANGKGRRPSAQSIERLARRQGLADNSYSAALDKLRNLAGTRKGPDLAQRLARSNGT